MQTYLGTTFGHISEIASGACGECWFKIPAAALIGAGTYLLGAENTAALIALMILVVVDFVTAIMAEWHAGEPIESKRAFKSAVKVAVYGLFVAAAHLTEDIVIGATFLDKMVISFLAITELISVTENVGRMGYAIPRLLLNKLHQMRDGEQKHG